MNNKSPRIRKGHYQTKYTTLPNETLQRSDITPEALGVLCRLCSLPEDWAVHKEWLQNNTKNCGRDKLTRIFKELQRLGYMVKYLLRNETGQIVDTEWHVFPEPQPDLIQENTEQLETRFPVSTEQLETRPTGNPHDGKPATTKEILIQSKDLNKTTTTTTRERETFDFKDYSEYADGSPSIPTPPDWAESLLMERTGKTDNFHLQLIKIFRDFVVLNLSHNKPPMELLQAKALFSRFLDKCKPSDLIPTPPAPRPCKRSAPATPPPLPLLTPAEENLLKRGEIVVGLEQRLGADKYQQVLKQYGLDN